MPVVVAPINMNAYERNIFIKNNQSFVVENYQAYLPFLGIVIGETYPNKTAHKISPLTQMLFLYFIYNNGNKLYIEDLTKEIPYTKMSISRAFREIEQLDKVYAGKTVLKNIFIRTPIRKSFMNWTYKFYWSCKKESIFKKRQVKQRKQG